jgi:hypothetical protein
MLAYVLGRLGAAVPALDAILEHNSLRLTSCAAGLAAPCPPCGCQCCTCSIANKDTAKHALDTIDQQVINVVPHLFRLLQSITLQPSPRRSYDTTVGLSRTLNPGFWLQGRQGC